MLPRNRRQFITVEQVSTRDPGNTLELEIESEGVARPE